jgi:hypothetical protein
MVAERGRIRTSDAVSRIAAFSGRCLKPLSHLSQKVFNSLLPSADNVFYQSGASFTPLSYIDLAKIVG